MTHPYNHIAVNWKNSPISLADSIEQVYQFLLIVRDAYPDFMGQWYDTGNSRKEALSKPIELTRESLKSLIIKAASTEEKLASYNDCFDFSYVFSAWNGGSDGEEISILIAVGNHNTTSLFNSCSIQLPSKGGVIEYFKDRTHQEKLAQLMIDYWQPALLRIDSSESWGGTMNLSTMRESEKEKHISHLLGCVNNRTNYHSSYNLITAMWGKRISSHTDSAKDICNFLVLLKDTYPDFMSQWYPLGNSRKEALSKPIELAWETVELLVTDKGGVALDDDVVVHEFFVWNGGGERESISIHIETGANMHGCNACSVTFPEEGIIAEYFKDRTRQEKFIQLMIDYWQPSKIGIDLDDSWGDILFISTLEKSEQNARITHVLDCVNSQTKCYDFLDGEYDEDYRKLIRARSSRKKFLGLF